MRIRSAPRRLLAHVRGLELREMQPAEECCGFGGTFSVKFAELSGAMARTKIDAIVRTGANTVVSLDSSCLMQIQGALSRAGSNDPHHAPGRGPGEPLIYVRRHSIRRSASTLADANLQLAIYTATGRLKDKRIESVAADALPDYQELRTQANAIKKHAIDNLDYYLEEFERNVEAHGGKVVYCKDGTEVSDFVLGLAKERGVAADRQIEIDDHRGSRSQRAAGAPRARIGGDRSGRVHSATGAREAVSHRRAGAAQDALRRRRRSSNANCTSATKPCPRSRPRSRAACCARNFSTPDIGISGANFLVADSGAVVIVENEGNARLTTTAPKIHIAIAGIEKVIPRAQDLAVFLKLLARSATGQALSVYTSFLSGPRRAGEIDGPDEFYVVLLDNGRTKLLPDRAKRQSLYCIRCAACLNTCPVYRKIGGHSFPWVYSGPIGAIITPQFMGVSHEPGAALRIEPVRRLRRSLPGEDRYSASAARSALGREESRRRARRQNRLEKFGYRVFAWLMTHPRVYAMAGRIGAPRCRLPKIGPVRAWISQRDLPPMPRQEFPRNLEPALMSREHILHASARRWAAARGSRRPTAPPVRIRVPEIDRRSAHRLDARARGGAGGQRRIAPSTRRTRARSWPPPSPAKRRWLPMRRFSPNAASRGSARRAHRHLQIARSCANCCATCDVGITSADYALADTGTLVMLSSPQEARMISLLPPAHIAVVPRERILERPR